MKSLAIARTTFVETIRQFAYILILILGTLLSFSLSWIVAFGFGREWQIVRESGVSGAVLVGILIVFLSVPGNISEEIRTRQILAILAKPISSFTLIWGKFVGLVFSLALAFVLLGASFSASLLVHDGWVDLGGVFSAFFLGFLQVLILGGVTLFFSLFLPTPVAVLFSYLVYMVGNLLPFLGEKLQGLEGPLPWAGKGLLLLFPDMVRLNAAFDFGAGRSASVFYLILAAVYSAIYIMWILYGASLVLKRKELL